MPDEFDEQGTLIDPWDDIPFNAKWVALAVDHGPMRASMKDATRALICATYYLKVPGGHLVRHRYRTEGIAVATATYVEDADSWRETMTFVPDPSNA